MIAKGELGLEVIIYFVTSRTQGMIAEDVLLSKDTFWNTVE